MHFTAGSWHGRGRVTACEQRSNGMVLCESNNSIGRLEAACWAPASVRLRAATTRSSQGSGRVVAWERHGMCELGSNTAGERHGMCKSALRSMQNGELSVSRRKETILKTDVLISVTQIITFLKIYSVESF
jgi:hypothetical protein